MGIILQAHFETPGDWGEFDTYTSDADFTVAAEAGLAQTASGLKSVINGTTAMYAQKAISNNTSGKLRARVYNKLVGMTMADNDSFPFAGFYDSGGGRLIQFVAYKIAGGTYRLQCAYRLDSGVAAGDTWTFTPDVEHRFEGYLLKATSNIASDGEFHSWIDGVACDVITGIDIYDNFANFQYARVGSSNAYAATTTGTIYTDELIVNDDGGLIGAVPGLNPATVYNLG